MVVCAVKLCRNYTGKNIKPPEGISFHRFPTDDEQKEEWIRAIRREPSWQPGTHCRVCSVHFDNSDFKISETGRRILHKDAVPRKNLYREEREDAPFSFRRKTRKSEFLLRSLDLDLEVASDGFCRGCLSPRAVYPITGALAAVLSLIVPVSPKDEFPQNICSTCCAVLCKLADFKTRCETTQEILHEARKQSIELTPDFLRTVDRKAHNLTFPLTTKKLPSVEITGFDVKEEGCIDVDNDVDIDNDVPELNDSNDAFDIFDRTEDLADDNSTEQKLFESDVKIEDNEFVLETDEGKTKVYGSIVPKHEIFVEVGTENILKGVRKRKADLKRKSKKIKREKEATTVLKKEVKEDTRNTKPRKTDEDYEIFAKDYSVDIVFLTKEEQVAEVEARKESDNYKNSRFKCEECFKGFTGDAAFVNHKAVHDPSVGNYVCEACKFRFPKRYKLLHHMTQHKMNFICKLCGHVSKLPSKAMEHFKWHNGVKYPCHYCDRVFIKRTSQFNHMRNRHGSAACDICQEIFSGARGLYAHMKKAHKEAVKSRCESCGVQFHSESALNKHLDTLPEGRCDDYVKSCAECGENFSSEDSLKDHMKDNHWKEIKCEKCNANFENEKLYRMHRVIHKEVRSSKPREVYSNKKQQLNKQRKIKKPVNIQKRMCEMCGLTWRSAAALKYHQRVHTGEKPHQCPLCPKSFRIHDSLQIHMNTHTGARPFKCPHCPKAFKSRTQNHKHQLVHTKVRRYRCDLCDKTFQTSTCVKTHIKTVHMKIPAPPRARRRVPTVGSEHMYMPHMKLDHMPMENRHPDA